MRLPMSLKKHASLSSTAMDSATVTPARLSVPLLHRTATTAPSAGVASLCAALDAALDAAAVVDQPSHCGGFVRALRGALARATTDEWLLTPAQREGSRDGYRRHLLAADVSGRYALVALVWRPGQTSPVHGHHTWCGYAVLSGTLTETLYEWNAALGCALPARDRRRMAGAVSYTPAGMGSIHRLHNAGTDVAVSLHVYGVSAAQVATHVNNVVRVATPAGATSDEFVRSPRSL
jgi:predicted metal-dependent enzyme (double-stranded beta helix superfamily)